MCICRCAKRSEEHTSELQSPCNLVCRLLLEKKKNTCASALSHAVGNLADCARVNVTAVAYIVQPHDGRLSSGASCISVKFAFFFYSSADHRDLHSFPTRRSSDLRDHSVEPPIESTAYPVFVQSTDAAESV